MSTHRGASGVRVEMDRAQQQTNAGQSMAADRRIKALIRITVILFCLAFWIIVFRYLLFR
jgi:hypothetical protein